MISWVSMFIYNPQTHVIIYNDPDILYIYNVSWDVLWEHQVTRNDIDDMGWGAPLGWGAPATSKTSVPKTGRKGQEGKTWQDMARPPCMRPCNISVESVEMWNVVDSCQLCQLCQQCQRCQRLILGSWNAKLHQLRRRFGGGHPPESGGLAGTHVFPGHGGNSGNSWLSSGCIWHNDNDVYI